jgi:hypothetical protein
MSSKITFILKNHPAFDNIVENFIKQTATNKSKYVIAMVSKEINTSIILPD